jgi:Amt family ammonium transporter
MMQAGFALIENGSVRHKNSSSILIKNMFDACFGAITFWLIGYGMAYGEKNKHGGFVSLDYRFFASSKFEDIEEDMYTKYIFHFSFAATSATIVSGALAERVDLTAYMIFSCLMTGLIYPIIVSWAWSDGWLDELGYKDFAGSGVVHVTGGTAAFFAAYIVGPRHGKGRLVIEKPEDVKGFEELKLKYPENQQNLFSKWFLERANDEEMKPSNMTLVVLGTFFLWVSWIFFNGGSTTDMFLERMHNSPKCIQNTILGAGPAGIVATFLKPRWIDNDETWDVTSLCNGILSGLISVTAICDDCDPHFCILIGATGGFIYVLGCKIIFKLKIDDPIEACVVHGFGGMWGIIA